MTKEDFFKMAVGYEELNHPISLSVLPKQRTFFSVVRKHTIHINKTSQENISAYCHPWMADILQFVFEDILDPSYQIVTGTPALCTQEGRVFLEKANFIKISKNIPSIAQKIKLIGSILCEINKDLLFVNWFNKKNDNFQLYLTDEKADFEFAILFNNVSNLKEHAIDKSIWKASACFAKAIGNENKIFAANSQLAKAMFYIIKTGIFTYEEINDFAEKVGTR